MTNRILKTIGFQISEFRILTFLGLLSLVVFSEKSKAQTLDDYLILAAENNPGLKASYARYEAALERVKQPALPDPELEAGIFLKPMERYMGNQQADLKLMQMFPWFGMIGTQREEAQHMADAQYQLFLEEKNQLMYLVKSTWYEMIRLQEEIRISRENLVFLEKYERLALIKYQAATGSTAGAPAQAMGSSAGNSTTSSGSSGMAGMGGATAASPSKSSASSGSMGASAMAPAGSTMSDVLQIRISIKELENTIEEQQADFEPLQIKFNQLLNREIRSEITIPVGFQPIRLEAGKMEVLDSIHSNNPMLAMYDSESAAYEQQAKMAKIDGRPMFGAGVNYMPFSARAESGMLMGGKDMVMPMVSLSLPIYRKKINSRVKEAELLQEATQLEKEKAKNLLAMKWANAYRDWENAERKIKLYSQQKDLTSQNLNLLVTSFSADGEDFEEILRAQQQLLNYQLQEINAINVQHQSLATLEMLSSASLTFNQ